ncbi:MAG: cell division protein FtsZ, partial [Pedosphaera parvula]|nr:cell division protein FtsZ [Pedosphaera parvula]
MISNEPIQTENQTAKAGLVIKVFGVGGAGIKLVGHMMAGGLDGVRFAVLNADARSLEASAAPEK